MTSGTQLSFLLNEDDPPLHGAAVAALESTPHSAMVIDPALMWQTSQVRVRWVSPALRELVTSTGMDNLSPEAVAELSEAIQQGRAHSVVALVPRVSGTQQLATITINPMAELAGEQGLFLVTVRQATAELASNEAVQLRTDTERRAQSSLNIVARVSVILNDDDTTTVLRDIADLLEQRIVRVAGIYVDEHGMRELIDLASELTGARDLQRLLAHSGDVVDPVRDLLLSTDMHTIDIDAAQPAVPGTMTEEFLASFASRDVAGGPVWALPILGRQRPLGILAAVPYTDQHGPQGLERPEGWSDEELTTILELVSRRVGMAMDNMQFYAREHRVAETLQRSMLPAPRSVESLDVWTYYAPSSEHAQVGGDWYDVLHVHGAGVGVVVGDVVGHDIEAAAAMGQLRSVVRAYATERRDAGEVLERVDGLLGSMDVSRPASCVYAFLEPHGDEWQMSYSRAGHLPPVLLRDGEARTLSDGGGKLIGFGEGPRPSATLTCLPGDVLTFYTDGLVERRPTGMKEGLQRLVQLLDSDIEVVDAAGVGEELLLNFGGSQQDDIAVVVIRIPETRRGGATGTGGPRQRRWQLPIETSSVRRARRVLRQTARAWGLHDTSQEELVVSELVSNAVLHGLGRIELRIVDTGEGLRMEVYDANPAPPRWQEARTTSVGGFGLHIVEQLAEWGWRPMIEGKVVWARMRPRSATITH